MKNKPTYAELEQRVKALEAECAQNRSSEEKLIEQFNFLQTMIDTIPLPIFYKDAHCQYTGCNTAFQNFVKKSPAQIIGKTVTDMGPSDITEEYLKRDRELMDHPGTQRYEWKIMTQCGELKHVVFHKATFCDKNGDVIGIIGAITDITEQKEVEKKLIEYQNRLRSLSSELLRIEERERRKIADDLHDSIGQTLAALKIKLGILHEPLLFYSHDNELSEIDKLIDQMIQSVRSMIFEISPPILYKLGLEAAVEWLIEKFQETSPIAYDFQYKTKLSIKDEYLLIFLFRAVRELLFNIVKHARARKAKITIKKNNAHIYITVWDDGIGFKSCFEHPTTPPFHSFGLFSIQERLSTLGGKLVIDSKSGYGSKVKMMIPLQAVSAGP